MQSETPGVKRSLTVPNKSCLPPVVWFFSRARWQVELTDALAWQQAPHQTARRRTSATAISDRPVRPH
jgi:hypothetical protein